MNGSKGINAKDAVEGIPVPDKAEGTDVCRFCYFTPDKCICDGPRPPDPVLNLHAIQCLQCPVAKSLSDEAEALKEVLEAARCIKHWHDRANGGMVVSASHVRALWNAIENYDRRGQ